MEFEEKQDSSLSDFNEIGVNDDQLHGDNIASDHLDQNYFTNSNNGDGDRRLSSESDSANDDMQGLNHSYSAGNDVHDITRSSSTSQKSVSEDYGQHDPPADNNINLPDRISGILQDLEKEHNILKETRLKDYVHIDDMNRAIEKTTQMCTAYEDHVTVLFNEMGNVRKTLNNLQNTIEKKLSQEGLLSWLGEQRAREFDKENQAKEKRLLASAAEIRVVIAKANADTVKALELVSKLEEETANAIVEANKAADDALETARAAEVAKKLAEEKAKIEEEARKKAEEAKRKKAEEEKRQREEEERRLAEMENLDGTPEEMERMREEAEKKNPNNWPSWVYSVEPGEIEIPIGCIIRTMPGSIRNRDEIDLELLKQLDGVLTLEDNEELVSNIIRIFPTTEETGNVELEEPLAIAIPHCAPRNQSRETVVKEKQDDGMWKELPTQDVLIENIKVNKIIREIIQEYKFVQCRTSHVNSSLAVVTRFRREEMVVPKRGCKVTASVDPRVCFTFKQATHKVDFNFIIEVQPVELGTVSDLRARFAEATDVISCSPMVAFDTKHINKLSKPVTVTIPVPPNPGLKTKRPVTAAANAIRAHKLGAVRPKSAFSARTTSIDEEADVLYIVQRQKEGVWVNLTHVQMTQSKNGDAVMFDVKEKMSKFLILRTKPNFTDQMAEAIPELLEKLEKERVVQFILKQRSDDPRDVIVVCTTANKSERLQRKLAEDFGYDIGPPASKEIRIHEGHKMNIKFRGNIKKYIEEEEEDNQQDLEFIFNSHIKTVQEFSVIEVDRFAQKSIECYRGFAQICHKAMVQIEVPISEEKTKQKNVPTKTIWVEKDVAIAELLINLPKPEPEPPKPLPRARITMKTDGLIDENLLKYIASELGDEWRRLAHYLNVRRVRIQAIMRNNVNDTENAVNDMLLTWAKKVPRSVNKTDVLCYALGRCGRIDLVEEIRDKEDDLRKERADSIKDFLLRKAFMNVMQNSHIVGDWKFLARELGVTETDLDDIDEKCSGMRDKCLRSMIKWKETMGNDANVDLFVKHLRRCRYSQVAEQVKLVCQLSK